CLRVPPPRSTLFPYTTLFRSHGFSASAFLFQILVVDRSFSSRGLAHTHFANPIAEIDLEVHVLHRVDAPLVDGRRFYFTLHFKLDRKSTRLNSSHVKISYAVF